MSKIVTLSFILLLVCMSCNNAGTKTVPEKLLGDEPSEDIQSFPEWMLKPINPGNGNSVVISVNSGPTPNKQSAELASVFLARLKSSYVVRYEAERKLESYYLPINKKKVFSVSVAKDADLIEMNLLNNIILIDSHSMKNHCVSMYSYPDSVKKPYQYLDIYVPQIEEGQTIVSEGHLFICFSSTASDIRTAADLAFKGCLELLVGSAVVNVESNMKWSEKVINLNDPAGYGESYNTFESRALLENLLIFSLTTNHSIKKNLHSYEVRIVMIKQL